MEIITEGANSITFPVFEYKPRTFMKYGEPFIEWEQIQIGDEWYTRIKPRYTIKALRIPFDCFIRIDGLPYRCGYSHSAGKWYASLMC